MPKQQKKTTRHCNSVCGIFYTMVCCLLSFRTSPIFAYSIRPVSSLQPWNNNVVHKHTQRVPIASHMYNNLSIPLKIQPFSPHFPSIGDKYIYGTLRHAAYRKDSTQWDGDDIRWISKIQRNIRRSTYDWQSQPVRNVLIISNMLLFTYQCINTIQQIQKMYPQSWSNYYVTILFDTIMGNSRPGPFTLKFVHSNIASMHQLYRYLTSGFLHGGLIHVLLNMDSLRQIPSWIETGLGAPLYMTTYLLAIIGGNLFHSISIVDRTTMCLGASGGICGLYGLMYVSLVRMGNHSAAWRVLRGMGLLFVWGVFITNISNAAHIGGFITGIAVAFISGPSYRSSYGLRRKNSLEVDLYNRSYRTVMGFDKIPINRGILPLPFLWLTIATAGIAHFKFKLF